MSSVSPLGNGKVPVLCTFGSSWFFRVCTFGKEFLLLLCLNMFFFFLFNLFGQSERVSTSLAPWLCETAVGSNAEKKVKESEVWSLILQAEDIWSVAKKLAVCTLVFRFLKQTAGPCE